MSRATSALRGGLKGAALGSALGPLGTVAGGALGAGIGALTGGKTKARREFDKQLASDLELLHAGKLGLSAAERAQLQGEASRGIGANVVAQQAGIARDALAGSDPGAYAAAQRGVSEGAAEGAAQASSKINDLSARIEEAKRNDIMQRLGVSVGLEQQDRAQSRGDLMAAFGDAATVLGSIKDPSMDVKGSIAASKNERAARRQAAGYSLGAPAKDASADLAYDPAVIEQQNRRRQETLDALDGDL